MAGLCCWLSKFVRLRVRRGLVKIGHYEMGGRGECRGSGQTQQKNRKRGKSQSAVVLIRIFPKGFTSKLPPNPTLGSLTSLLKPSPPLSSHSNPNLSEESAVVNAAQLSVCIIEYAPNTSIQRLRSHYFCTTTDRRLLNWGPHSSAPRQPQVYFRI